MTLLVYFPFVISPTTPYPSFYHLLASSTIRISAHIVSEIYYIEKAIGIIFKEKTPEIKVTYSDNKH